jgi:tRNA(His) guanylyltransferase
VIDVDADFRDASGITLDGNFDHMKVGRGRRMIRQEEEEEEVGMEEKESMSMPPSKQRKMVHFDEKGRSNLGIGEDSGIGRRRKLRIDGHLNPSGAHEDGIVQIDDGVDDEEEPFVSLESHSMSLSDVEGPKDSQIVHAQLDTKEFYRYIGVAKRFRDIEKRFVSATVLKKGLPYVIRCDGRAFSKFCSGMVRPHDVRFYRVMKLTAQDAIEKFNANSVYLESDELSLLFFPDEDGSAFFRGRVQKIVSVVASYIAARFNFHILKENFSDLDLPVQTRMHAGEAHFDARVFNLANDDAMMDCCLWRMCDGMRNSINNLGRQFLTQDQMNKKPIADVLLSLMEKGILWEEEPDWYKYGALIKLNKNKKKASHVIWNCFLRRSAETKQLLKERFALNVF